MKVDRCGLYISSSNVTTGQTGYFISYTNEYQSLIIQHAEDNDTILLKSKICNILWTLWMIINL